MVASKTYFTITAHPEVKYPSHTTKYPNFVFFYYTIFLVPFADTISTEPSPVSLQCHLESVWLEKVMGPNIKISLVK